MPIAFHILGNYPHEDWMDSAICRQYPTDIFFPENGIKATEAKAICSTCINRSACLEYALEHGIKDGVWGGVAERDRRKMATARRRLAAV